MRRLENSFLKKIPIAHRGFHDDAHPENSLLSAEHAIENGYVIELDVRWTKDKKVIVFHDDNLSRTCGVDKKICDLTYDELKDYELFGIKGAHIPLFSEFLTYVNGRTPLLVELKVVQKIKGDFVSAVVDELREYKGEFVVQSFSPFYLMKLKKIAPEFIRGQLITKDLSEMPMRTLHDRLNYAIVWIFGFRRFNWISDPDFYNIDIRCFGKYQKRYSIRNVLSFVVTNEEEYIRAMRCTDNVVFENMRIDISEHRIVSEEAKEEN